MDNKNLIVATNYCTAMSKKDLIEIGKYLHDDVHVITPFLEKKGKKEYLETLQEFMSFFTTYTVRAMFGSKDQVMLAYDVEFNGPFDKCHAAALMTFNEAGLITDIELFFDGRPFEKMR